MHPAVERAHRQLIERLIARGALWSSHLVAAFRETPRHYFLERIFARDISSNRWREYPTVPLRRIALRMAYSDRALTTRLSEAPAAAAVPVSSSSQPSLMAQMLEDLQLEAGFRTLEIGAGTGYNAALIARAAGPVVSLDVDDRVVVEAKRHAQRFPDRSIEFVTGDGRQGWQPGAPYDRIVVTAASPDLERAWLEQSIRGGLVQVPLSLAPGLAYLAQGRVVDGVFDGSLTRPAYFIALRAADESGDERPGLSSLRDPVELDTVAAPWKDWAPRQAPPGGIPFVRSLAFLAWLEGMDIGYRAANGDCIIFGLGDRSNGATCWLGQETWRVTGKSGSELGEYLWRKFLAAGGPWPTEYRLRAAFGEVPVEENDAAMLRYRKRGPMTDQIWELPRKRQRPFTS